MAKSIDASRLGSPACVGVHDRRNQAVRLDFKLSPLGKGILKWCAKSDQNSDDLVAWIKEMAQDSG